MPKSDSKEADELLKNGSEGQKQDPVHRVRLPGFIDEEVGLGDVIKSVTYAAGIKPCGGCEHRAAVLNRWLVFSPRSPRQSPNQP